MKIQIQGTVIMINDSANSKVLVVELSPAIPGKKDISPVQRKQIQLATNDHKYLDGLQRGQSITITIEQ